MREEICEDHHWTYTGTVPNTGRCICTMCNLEQRGYHWTPWQDQCDICLGFKLEPNSGTGPITEEFPECGCQGIWCDNLKLSYWQR